MTPKDEVHKSGLFQVESNATHRRRVRLMLLFGSAGLVLLGAAWAVVFGARNDWLTMTLDTALVATGFGGMVLTRMRRTRAAALLLLGALFAVLWAISALLDVPSPNAPRSMHHFYLALAVSSFLLFRDDRLLLRHGIPLLCLLAFFYFASATGVGVDSHYGLPDSVRVPGTWFNNLSALVILYLLLHIMQADVGERSVLEVDLRKALASSQFQLYYQPQVTETGSVTGAEALLRWHHPVRGMVPPDDFIGLAEQTGLIVPLGQQVLEMACAQLAVWARNPETAGLSMSVNVSAQQFGQAEFVPQALAVMERSGAPRHKLKLELELTESMLVNDVEDIIGKMTALKAYGVGFSLDDFGTGYSSLSYLKRLPLDQLKIDKAFVRDVLTNPHDAAIARTVVSLGQNLGFAVIAEGVETEGQKVFLADNGCHGFQGDLFSRPLAAPDFQAYVLSRAKPNVVYLAA
jgi:EAL domain-containing protein (putative c-di-GMP-specific phosphodiesterase class I)